MNKKRKIHIFGNELLDFDNLPILMKPDLEKAFPEIEFVIQDPSENLKPENKELTIIDTVEGIDDIIIINDISQIQTSPVYSLHDFDLGMNIKLLNKIGLLDKILIFGVPMDNNDLLFNKLIKQINKHIIYKFNKS